MTHDAISARAYALWRLMSTGGKRDNFRAANQPAEYYWFLAEADLRGKP